MVYRAEAGRRRLVGGAGNAPVVTSDVCFATPDLQAGSRNTSQIGSGGGSCAHGGRAYEARLNLILPAEKWPAEPKLDRAKVGGVDGYRPPMSLLAGQVHYLSATTPIKVRRKRSEVRRKQQPSNSLCSAFFVLHSALG